jgi:hypothetical protein
MNLSEIEGFEEHSDYAVTSDGNVISYKGREDRVLKGGENNYGYLHVILSLNGKRKMTTIHTLVAKAFCKGYSEGLTVDHIDENKKNNNFTNLQWLTRGDNARKGNNKPVAQLNLDGKLIKIWDSATQAQQIGGFNQGNISSVCLGKLKTHAGFKWEYKI